MPLRRRRSGDTPPTPPAAPPPAGLPPQEIVRLYLRGQNLEQMQRIDEAVGYYEQAVQSRFDAIGPYDRLIAIYLARSAHGDVMRIADAALSAVRTFEDKKAWYRSTREEAEERMKTEPDRRGAEF